MEGSSITEISNILEISRNTVYKYLEAEDLSPQMPVRKSGTSLLDPYRSLIESWLDEDTKNWRKQRHTAKRIWQRLQEEHNLDVSESTVRHYVCRLKKERGGVGEQFLDLVWAPGEAQADFGEADFYLRGTRTRLSFFVLSFPFSNVGLAQVFPGENAECVCQALKNIFEFIGGIPTRIVFDNATGIGRRVGGIIRTSKTFTAFCAHYGFGYSFCNPNSGHEKGNVERKVGYIRSNLFVPVRTLDNLDVFNKHLIDESMALSAKKHWLKGEEERALFVEDQFALAGLPAAAFDVVRYERRRADKYGKVRIDGNHLYSSSPEYAKCELICCLRSTTITIATDDGTVICTHKRAYGNAPTDTTNPANQLTLLARKAGGWQNSQVREAMPNKLREHMDGLSQEELKSDLRLIRDEVSRSGWDCAISACSVALDATGRLDTASVAVAANGLSTMPVNYDEPIDLGVYDAAMKERR